MGTGQLIALWIAMVVIAGAMIEPRPLAEPVVTTKASAIKTSP